MPLNRAIWFNSLVDDSGTGTNGTIWDISQVNGLFVTIDARVRDWVNVPFLASNFIASSGSWVVEAADIVSNRYAIAGQIVVWDLKVSATSVSGSPGLLYLAVPAQTVLPPYAAHFSRVGYVLDNLIYREAFVRSEHASALALEVSTGAWANSTNGTFIWLQTIYSVNN